jgi:hypothetical protein
MKPPKPEERVMLLCGVAVCFVGILVTKKARGSEMMFATLTAALGLFSVAFAGKVSPNHGFKSKYEGASLVFTEDWSKGIDFSLWKHEITMGGGGNWEFEYYINNRSNSFVENGTLMIKPTLTADKIGAQQVSGAVSITLSSLSSLQLLPIVL